MKRKSKKDILNHVAEGWNQTQHAEIEQVEDLSPGVSTNYVFRLDLADHTSIYAKWSRFGKFEHFLEDHIIIQAMHDCLPDRYAHFLCRSVVVDGLPYVYPSSQDGGDSWVAYYHPIATDRLLPKRLEMAAIKVLGHELAQFHLACSTIADDLPQSSKSTSSDIAVLLGYLEEDRTISDDVRHLLIGQCQKFLAFNRSIPDRNIQNIPVMVDWNIGNFSVTASYHFYSRWDYDWFRMTSRMMDFYFFARVVSDAGDRSKFTYEIDVLKEERFIVFLRNYHKVYPLRDTDLQLLPELYRFFLLNYVIKFGNAFFRDFFAEKLRFDSLHVHFDSIETFDWKWLKNALA